MVVASKWTNTDVDCRDMQKLKLDQILRVSNSNMSSFFCHLVTLVIQRNFGWITIFDFFLTLLCTWETILMYAISSRR